MARRYVDECHIDLLNSRGQLPDRRWKAGVTYRKYWLAYHGSPAVIAGYGESLGRSTGLHESEYMTLARQQIDAAHGAVTNDEMLAMQAIAGQDECCYGRLALLQSACLALADMWDVPVDFCRGYGG